MKVSQSIAFATLLATLPAVADQDMMSPQEFQTRTNLFHSYDAGILTLAGHAASEVEVLRAENDAYNVEGVIEVRNFATYAA